MSEKTIVVNHDALEAAAVNFRAHHATLLETLENLESGLAPMIATWSGSAQAMYLEKKAAWDTAATELAVVLASVQANTHLAHQGYIKTVKDVMDIWD